MTSRVGQIATVRWAGHDPFTAECIEERPGGSYRMRVLSHGPRSRVIAGHEVIALPNEAVSWADPVPPLEAPVQSAGAALDQHLTATIAELKSTPSPLERHKGKRMATPLLAKIKALTVKSRDFNERLSADLDKLHADYEAAETHKLEAMSVHRSHVIGIAESLQETKEALTALANAPFESGS